MTDELVIEARKGGPCAELGDRCRAIEAASGCFCAAVADRIEALTAERDRLREALDYILDGMGIAEPDYDIDPDDDFLDAANSEWVRDTLTRLAAALKGETS